MIQIQQTKLTIGYFVLAVFFFMGYFIVPPFLTQRTFDFLNRELSTKTTTIEQYVVKKNKLFEKIAQEKETTELCSQEKKVSQNSQEYAHYLEKHLSSCPGYHNVTIIRQNGDILFSQHEADILFGKNISDSTITHHWIGNFFQQAMITQTTDIFLTKTTQNHFLFLYTPILKDNKTIGFIFAELCPKELFSIIHNHNFHKNADILLGQYTNKLSHISLTQKQHDALSDMIFYDSYLMKASKGDMNQKIIMEKNQQPMFAVWHYYPFLDIGLLIKSSYKSITHWSFLFFSFFLLFFLLGIYSFHKYFNTMSCAKMKRYSLSLAKIIKEYSPYALLGMLLCGLLIFIGLYKHLQNQTQATTRIKTNVKTRTLSQQLNIILSKIKEAGTIAAEKLHQTPMQEENLSTFVHNLLQEHPNIYSITIAFEPYTFNHTQKLFSPCWMRTSIGIDKTYIENSYDYTTDQNGSWYKEALSNKSVWELPYTAPALQKKLICYSTVFYDQNQKPLGVIRIAYKASHLNNFIENLGNSTAQRCIIIDKSGNLIYHPTSTNVASNKTIFTLANITCKTTSQALREHFAKIIPSFIWHQEEQIQESGWIVASAFDKTDISHVRKSSIYLMIIILCSLFTLFFAIFLILSHCSFIQKTQQLYRISSKAYVGLSTIGIGLLWILAYQQPWMPNSSTNIIRDQGNLTSFLETVQQKTYAYNMPLIPIPTGFVIRKFDDTLLARTSLIGTAWQIYDKEILKSITPGITIAKAQKITITKAFEREEKNRIIIGWDISAEIFQEANYTLYPFNKKDLTISIRHTDQKNNVICVPDFNGYSVSPENPYPWLDTSISDLEDSFFSYPDNDESIETLKTHKNLNLHIVSQENMLNSLIAYVIPLIIGLFSIFALLWLSPDNRVGGFSGLLFAFIFLHRALRGSLNLTSITYLEYFFLTTYITLLIVTAMASIAAARKVPDEESKYYFWPIQTTAWLILTIALFFY